MRTIEDLKKIAAAGAVEALRASKNTEESKNGNIK